MVPLLYFARLNKFITNFQKICAGESDTVGSSLPNISAYYLFLSTVVIIILMVAIKTVCRQIEMAEESETTGFIGVGNQAPKNMDSMILNLTLLLLLVSSTVLHMVYWKG